MQHDVSPLEGHSLFRNLQCEFTNVYKTEKCNGPGDFNFEIHNHVTWLIKLLCGKWLSVIYEYVMKHVLSFELNELWIRYENKESVVIFIIWKMLHYRFSQQSMISITKGKMISMQMKIISLLVLLWEKSQRQINLSLHKFTYKWIFNVEEAYVV